MDPEREREYLIAVFTTIARTAETPGADLAQTLHGIAKAARMTLVHVGTAPVPRWPAHLATPPSALS